MSGKMKAPWVPEPLFTGAAKKSEVQLAHAKLLGEAKATEVRYDRRATSRTHCAPARAYPS